MMPSKQLLDDMYLERVRRAREMPIEEKFFAGARLFDMACNAMRDGIRHDFPDADEAKVEEILHQRFALKRRLEESR